MNRLNETDDKGIKLSERLRANVYPDSEEQLEDDLIARPESSDESDGKVVDSDKPDSKEWPAREKSQRENPHHH